MKTGNHWQKLSRQTNDPAAWSGYKNFKHEVKRELITDRSKDFRRRFYFTKRNDSNAMWKTIRSCIPKKSANSRVNGDVA